jgi:peptide methionine sulfoxide reductase MsrB
MPNGARGFAEQYQVLRQGGTERAFTGKYEKNKLTGQYQLRRLRCALVRSSHQVRQRLRLAQLHRAGRA